MAEAEILVREWLTKHAKENPASITRDAVADGTGVSTGAVSNTAAWKAFRDRRDAEAKPGAREVPFTETMQAVVPADCARPDELAARTLRPASARWVQGTSLVPVLEDPRRPWKTAAFTATDRPGGVRGRGVRTERYRYAEWGDEQTAQLFDHDTDPHEYRDLAHDPAHAGVVAQMRRLLKEGWPGALPPAAAR